MIDEPLKNTKSLILKKNKEEDSLVNGQEIPQKTVYMDDEREIRRVMAPMAPMTLPLLFTFLGLLTSDLPLSLSVGSTGATSPSRRVFQNRLFLIYWFHIPIFI